MLKDKDGRPILTASDWKTGEDRKKEPSEITKWGAIWRSFLLLGLIVIVGLAVIYWASTGKEGVSIPFTEEVQIFGPVLSLIFLVIFGFILHGVYFGGQCSKCKRRGAIEKTGATKRTDRGFWSGVHEEEEYKCKYCGDRYWLNISRDTGGGGCGS